MKLSYLCAMGGLLSCSVALAGHGKLAQLLNQVSYPVTVEKWVSTNTANVTVAVDATVSSKDLATLHQQISQKLQQLVPNAQWHIIAFNRNQTSSGLQQVQAIAQARLVGAELAQLTSNVSKVSKPGLSFKVNDVAFVPSFEELQQAKMALRQKVYQQVKQELNQLNETYPKQQFTVHNIQFDTQAQTPEPRAMVLTKMAAAPSTPVSSKVVMSANVTLASRNGRQGLKQQGQR